MDTYIGLDAHVSSCRLGVLGPGGKRLGSHVVETNAKALIEVLRRIPGRVRTRGGEWIKAPVQQTRGLNGNFNRTLKHIFKGAVTTVILSYAYAAQGRTEEALAELEQALELDTAISQPWRPPPTYRNCGRISASRVDCALSHRTLACGRG